MTELAWSDYEEVKNLIYRYKAKLPLGFPILTIDQQAGLILIVDGPELAKLDIHDQIRVAEVFNALQVAINETGIPCGISKTRVE